MKLKFNTLLLLILLGFGFHAQAQVTITGTGTGGWNQPGNLALASTDGIVWTATNFEIVGDGNMKISEGGTWGNNRWLFCQHTCPGFPIW